MFCVFSFFQSEPLNVIISPPVGTVGNYFSDSLNLNLKSLYKLQAEPDNATIARRLAKCCQVGDSFSIISILCEWQMLYFSCVPDPHWYQCKSGILGQCGSGSRFKVLMTKNRKKLQLKIFFFRNSLNKGRPSYRRSLQHLKREHQALQNIKFLLFILLLWVFFVLLDQYPDPHSQCGSGSSRPKSVRIRIRNTSVADPDPPDPHVFGPPGSGSTSKRYGSGSGSFCHHAKIVTKTLIPTILWLFLTFLSLKNDVNVPSKSNKQKKLCQKISFLLASWRSMTEIAGSGSGSISQRHGSADPDPDPPQNVMDPQHCETLVFLSHFFNLLDLPPFFLCCIASCVLLSWLYLICKLYY